MYGWFEKQNSYNDCKARALDFSLTWPSCYLGQKPLVQYICERPTHASQVQRSWHGCVPWHLWQRLPGWRRGALCLYLESKSWILWENRIPPAYAHNSYGQRTSRQSARSTDKAQPWLWTSVPALSLLKNWAHCTNIYSRLILQDYSYSGWQTFRWRQPLLARLHLPVRL